MAIRLTGDAGADFFITLAVGLVIIATLRYILYSNRSKTIAVAYREEPDNDDEPDDDDALSDAEWVWGTGAGWSAVIEAGEALGIGGPGCYRARAILDASEGRWPASIGADVCEGHDSRV
jgi:hypothetical protein